MTFHVFRDLPVELRLAIWGMAARDTTRPGVQFLSIFHMGYSLDEIGFDDERGDTPYETTIWDDPRSSYTVGQGLWNACRESRQVMLSIHKDEWAEVRPGSKWVLGLGIEPVGDSVTEATGRAQHQMQMPIVTLPLQDLIIPVISHWGSNGFPLMDCLYNLRTVIGRRPVRHIGITLATFARGADHTEFAPVLYDVLKYHTNECTTIWLIDESIKRGTNLQEQLMGAGGSFDSERKVFEGNECRYVEVLPADKDEDWTGDTAVKSFIFDHDSFEDVWRRMAMGKPLSRAYVKQLNETLAEYSAGSDASHESEDNVLWVGLLAYEPFGRLKKETVEKIAKKKRAVAERKLRDLEADERLCEESLRKARELVDQAKAEMAEEALRSGLDSP